MSSANVGGFVSQLVEWRIKKSPRISFHVCEGATDGVRFGMRHWLIGKDVCDGVFQVVRLRALMAFAEVGPLVVDAAVIAKLTFGIEHRHFRRARSHANV